MRAGQVIVRCPKCGFMVPSIDAHCPACQFKEAMHDWNPKPLAPTRYPKVPTMRTWDSKPQVMSLRTAIAGQAALWLYALLGGRS